ncbi:hypothetical protein [Poriferisphaera corsica]|uniref:hypothetical protein n=1 Tax=Poriferisphaera corsica TaxID=2528020 RepID=UPI0019099444|nr:hypothetical protein [Poriferisphaera corsica]
MRQMFRQVGGGVWAVGMYSWAAASKFHSPRQEVNSCKALQDQALQIGGGSRFDPIRPV